MCRSSIGWSDTHHPLISRNHTDSSNPIASAGVVCGQTGTFKTPVFWRLARLEQRLALGIATRNATPHSAMHRASMGATDGQRNWPKMRKTLGKPGFFAERTGTEQPAKSIGKSKFQNEASQHPTRAATTSHALASHRLTNSPCSELLVLHRKISQLAGLITRWSFLLENRSQRARVLPTVTGEEFYAQDNRHLD
jgi:hypothetical protein